MRGLRRVRVADEERIRGAVVIDSGRIAEIIAYGDKTTINALAADLIDADTALRLLGLRRSEQKRRINSLIRGVQRRCSPRRRDGKDAAPCEPGRT